jgi:hypothetical protein
LRRTNDTCIGGREGGLLIGFGAPGGHLGAQIVADSQFNGPVFEALAVQFGAQIGVVLQGRFKSQAFVVGELPQQIGFYFFKIIHTIIVFLAM